MSHLVESITHQPITRSAFFVRTAGLLGVVLADARRVGTMTTGAVLEHPEPRTGVTSGNVLGAAALDGKSDTVQAAFAAARSYPAIFDGLACGCGCSGKDRAHRSLLSCYESLQPTGCRTCQMEAELVSRLAKQEKPLSEIRAAVDKEFG